MGSLKWGNIPHRIARILQKCLLLCKTVLARPLHIAGGRQLVSPAPITLYSVESQFLQSMSKTLRQSVYPCVRLLSRVIPMVVLFACAVCNGASFGEKVQPHFSARTDHVSNPQNPRRRSNKNKANRQIDGTILGNEPRSGRNVVRVRVIGAGEAMPRTEAYSSCTDAPVIGSSPGVRFLQKQGFKFRHGVG